jgi:hypothetical protein
MAVVEPDMELSDVFAILPTVAAVAAAAVSLVRSSTSSDFLFKGFFLIKITRAVLLVLPAAVDEEEDEANDDAVTCC